MDFFPIGDKAYSSLFTNPDTCNLIANPENGDVVTEKTSPFEPNDTVGFTCNEGYTISDNTNATCTEDGTWDRDPPNCGMSYYI